MDDLDKKIINCLQDGIPLIDEPYAEIAKQLNINETELLQRIKSLLENKTLSRFGPMYDAAKLGGDFSLVAIKVPETRFDEVTDIVNSYEEVAHNYHREHEFNMWYVLATETAQRIEEVNNSIEERTGLKVYNMPKLDEYYIGLKLIA